MIHCFLLADDTIVIISDRDTFLQKCNPMSEYFDKKRLSLNLSKSKYMIINTKGTDLKSDAELSAGKFEY